MGSRIGPYSFEQYCEKIVDFHGGLAPGVVIGGFMVDLATRILPMGILYDVICETASCLPDAVQILTPCSIGNQWMKIIDVGRYALTCYDKETGKGVRVHLAPERLERWPAIKEWFLKLKPKEEQDGQRLLSQIEEAGTDILGIEQINVAVELMAKRHKKSVSICPLCNEAYPSDDGAICLACKEECLPYKVQIVNRIGDVPSRVIGD